MNQLQPTQLSPQKLEKWLRSSSTPFIIDVREEEELAVANFSSPVLHLPLSQSERWISSLADHLPRDRSIVVLCHAGIRSWNFALWLLNQGLVDQIWNLDGGIDGWSINIDPSIPRY
tara:strand:- start:17394 stop:17744 length:351 start_codon:yes stop_codon:yes gene_type:complete